jgi:exonuclease VII large subunit
MSSNKQRALQYYYNNREQILKKMKEKYDSSKKLKEYNREYYQNNKDRIKKRFQQYYDDNKERILNHEKVAKKIYNIDIPMIPKKRESPPKQQKRTKETINYDDIEEIYKCNDISYIDCKCGGTVQLSNYNIHKRSFNHKIYEKQKINK